MITLLITPIIGILGTLIIEAKNARRWALMISLVVFIESIWMYMGLDKTSSEFSHIVKFGWENKSIVFGVDGISIYYILLTTILIPICILVSWESVKILIKEYLISLLIIEWLLIGVFSVLDLIGFYVLYEGVLIPMFYIIGVWGSREQKITAAYYFFMYTLIGSVLMLISIMYVYTISGTTDYITLMGYELEGTVQKVILVGFLASLAVKIPSYPFHIWLPQAHVEAPVAGSVLLAGILIKLGSYGIIRFGIGLTPIACEYFAPAIFTLSILGVIYASFSTLRQTDMKRVIAYSSVGHMAIATIGIFTLTTVGIEGSIYLQIAHGIVSSALFIVVTQLYERGHTRIIKYYRGVTMTMPIYSTMFLLFTMANIAVPGTANFVGEIMTFRSVLEENLVVGVLAGFGVILSAGYGLFLYNRISFGALSSYFVSAPRDLTFREFNALLPLAFLTILYGMWPALIIDVIHPSVIALLS